MEKDYKHFWDRFIYPILFWFEVRRIKHGRK